jgi:hypothetical protein
VTDSQEVAVFKHQLRTFLSVFRINSANILDALEGESLDQKSLSAAIELRRADYVQVGIETAYEAVQGDESSKIFIIDGYKYQEGLREFLLRLEELPRA